MRQAGSISARVRSRAALLLVVLAGSVASPAPASAEDAEARARPSAVKAAPAPGARSSQEIEKPGRPWGWLVVFPSIVAGATLTGYGLTFSCSDDATSCQRKASAAIAGGVGIASFGTIVGITIVQGGDAPRRAPARARKVRVALQPAPSPPGPPRPAGAILRVEGTL